MDSKSSYEFGRFRLQAAERVLLRDGHPVALPPKDIETLVVLIENRGHIVEKEELLRRVWPDVFVEEGNVARRISNLRSLLGADSEGRQYIDTVPKRGYRFNAEVFEVQGNGAHPQSVAQVERIDELPQNAPARKQSPFSGRRIAVVALVLAGILILVLAILSYRPTPSAAPRRVMVAIMPVDNMSGRPDYDYVTDGMTEEIISQLGQVNPDQLGVIARTSSMAYKGTHKRVDEIGHELGAEYLLESSFRGSIEHIRITAQLIRVKDQSHIWAQNYDRDIRDIVSLEDEIAQTIAGEIELKLAPPKGVHPEASSPVSPDAYLLYLKGRQAWNTRSQEGLRQSLTYFRQAIDKEPTFARAHAGVADALNIMLFYGFVTSSDVVQEARHAAEDAIRLDDSLPEGHAALAYVSFVFIHDWAKADQEFRKALALGPNYAPAHHWYALYLAAVGKREESFKEIQAAEQLDPVSPIIDSAKAYIHYFGRDYDVATAECKEALKRSPDFPVAHLVLGLVSEAQHHPAEALQQYQTVIALRGSQAGPFYKAQAARALALSGRLDEARQILPATRDSDWNLADLAMAYDAIGKRDEALTLLERAKLRGEVSLTWLKVDPIFDPVRNEPRFHALMQQMKFPN